MVLKFPAGAAPTQNHQRRQRRCDQWRLRVMKMLLRNKNLCFRSQRRSDVRGDGEAGLGKTPTLTELSSKRNPRLL